jgi:antitoxin HicB
MTDTIDIATGRFPSFKDHLKERGRLERVTSLAEKMIVAGQISRAMDEQGLTKSALAARMGTSRAQLDRVLNPNSQNVTIETLARAAEALGQRFHMEIVRKAA